MRFDELVDQFQRMPGVGEELKAKRLSKLSVKLLRTCTQINKGLEWHEKHVVVVRLMEFLGAGSPTRRKSEERSSATVCESFAIPQDRMEPCRHGIERRSAGGRLNVENC